ncbi:MAG: MFS transporter [Deltaproteobacteria bacterium]|nr:MFS transporter [Deltaproteobacteria bacterium]
MEKSLSKSARTRTLFLIYLRQTSAALIIYQPIFIPFLLHRGMDMIDIALLQTAYNLGVLLLDIPTGYVADRWGRKWALAATNLSLAVGTALICLGHTLSTFMIAELFYALAIALDSGTHSAYLFEWLRREKLEANYYRYDALGTFIYLITSTAGTLVAGFYAEKDLMIPVAATIALTFIGFPVACLLPSQKTIETPGGQPEPRIVLSDILAIVGETLKTPGVRWAVGVTVIWFWARQYVNLIISQPYFMSINLHFSDFGILYSILTFGSGLIAFFSRRFMKLPDLRPLTAMGLVLIPVSFAIMGLTNGQRGLAGFFLFAVPYGLCTAITNTLLNRQYSRHESRATFLSIVDTCVRLVASILALGLGWVLAHYGPARALQVAMLLSSVMALFLMPGLFRFGTQTPEAKGSPIL